MATLNSFYFEYGPHLYCATGSGRAVAGDQTPDGMQWLLNSPTWGARGDPDIVGLAESRRAHDLRLLVSPHHPGRARPRPSRSLR